MSDEIAYATIAELGARYRKRDLSPVEVTQALLARIEKLDPILHAFVTLTADSALAEARSAEEALRRGDARPLLGIPVAHKDIYLTRGVRPTGADTGGSIRGPAAFCGIVGLKPTYGRSSRAGVLTLSWTLDHTGPMARTVQDCAFLLQPLAGYDPADPASSRAPVDDYVAPLGRDIRGLKIGVPRAYFLEEVDAEVARAFEEALETLRRLGAEVRDVQIPSLRGAHSFLLILMAEAYAYHESDIREHPELYGDVLRERILAGALVTASEYTQAQRIRSEICRETAEVLKTVDVLASPTALKPATPFAQAFDPEFAFPKSNMAPFNLTGLPTLALPCGFSASGLPVSFQLSGRPFEEGTVLRVGHTYEQATTWHTRRPPVWDLFASPLHAGPVHECDATGTTEWCACV